MSLGRKNIRLKGYDYSSKGWYFITTCTYNHKSLFGQITNGKMKYSSAGEIALTCWREISVHFPYVELGEFVIMPNHLHGIIGIVGTRHGVSLQGDDNKFGKTIAGSVSSIIGQYKSSVTRKCKKYQIPFSWQPRFYDRIIRSQDEYDKIEYYIQSNITNWEDDELFV